MRDFEKYVMEKYPSLFEKDENGNPIPAGCGIWCPEGWEGIVDDLCGAINQYTTKTYRSKMVIKNRLFYFIWRIPYNVLSAIHKFIYRRIINKPSFNKLVNKLEHYLIKKSGKHISYEKVYCRPVTIDQIKEKFGGLRFYYTGGDKEVAGMVALAEFIASNSCELTGKKGKLCSRNGWLKTLSPEVIKDTPELSGFVNTHESQFYKKSCDSGRTLYTL
jgi:hypothetical protein